MSQQNFKMVVIREKNYHDLNQLRSKYGGSFSDVVERLLEIAEMQEQEPLDHE
jgi:hypothetical protein